MSALVFNSSASLLAAYSGSSGTLRIWTMAQSWTQSMAQRLRGLEPTLPGAVLKVTLCVSHWLPAIAVLTRLLGLSVVAAVMIASDACVLSLYI